MSSLAAQDARERFSRDAIVGEYEAFYEYTLASPSGAERNVRAAADPGGVA
jgi:hypothetical protein